MEDQAHFMRALVEVPPQKYFQQQAAGKPSCGYSRPYDVLTFPATVGDIVLGWSSPMKTYS